jgi:hypothetical protein
MQDHFPQIINIWQPALKEELTSEDAREVATNVVGFFLLLAKWKNEVTNYAA